MSNDKSASNNTQVNLLKANVSIILDKGVVNSMDIALSYNNSKNSGLIYVETYALDKPVNTYTKTTIKPGTDFSEQAQQNIEKKDLLLIVNELKSRKSCNITIISTGTDASDKSINNIISPEDLKKIIENSNLILASGELLQSHHATTYKSVADCLRTQILISEPKEAFQNPLIDARKSITDSLHTQYLKQR